MSVQRTEPMRGVNVNALLRLGQPDGTTTEVAWDDSGRAHWRSLDADSGETLSERVDQFDPDGAFVVGEEAASFGQSTNVFGSLVERAEYADGTVVEQSFDTDSRLRLVKVQAVWGHQTMELWPDGSRSLVWDIGGLHGTRRWDASGVGTSVVEQR